MRLAALLFFLGSLATMPARAFAQGMPADFTVEGRLYDIAGAPLNSTTAYVRLELLSESNSACVLYREDFGAQDLTSSNPASVGVFAYRMGTGTLRFAAGGHTLPELFQNGSYIGDSNDDNIATGAECTGTINAANHPLVRIRFKTGGVTYETMSPDTRVTAVPNAMVADNANTLQGKTAANFLLTNTSTSLIQTNVENVFSTTNYTKILSLLSGASYIPAAPVAPVNFNSQRLTGIADPTGAQDAATKNYADTKMGGKDVDNTGVGVGIGGGKVLTWDQALNKWVAQAAPTAGVTSLVMGNGMVAGTITSAGTIAVDTGTTGSKIVQLNGGKLPAVDGSALTNLPVVSVNGKTNVVTLVPSDIVGFGTAALRNVGTNTGNVLEFLTNNALPVVDGFAVTNINATFLQARAVSNAPPLGGQILTWNNSAARWEPQNAVISGITDLTGDVTATGPGSAVATIGANKVTSSKLSATGIAVNRILITDPTTGATVTYATCSNGDVMKYNTVTGWGCATDATGGTVNLVVGGTGLIGGTISNTGTLSVDVGTLANQIVRMNGSALLPAVDASLLYNLSVKTIQGNPVSAQGPASGQVIGWNGSQWQPMTAGAGSVMSVAAGNGLSGGTFSISGTLSVDVGTIAYKIIQLTPTGQYPGVDGSLITNLNALRLQGRFVTPTTPLVGQMLKWSGTQWDLADDQNTGGTVLSVVSGNGLTAGTITTNGTLSVDVGSTANKIVQITSGGQYPQADGNLISNVNAVKLQGRDVISAAPLANQVLRWVGSQWVPSNDTSGTVTSVSSGTGLLGGTFTAGGTLSVDVGSTSGKIVQITSTGQYPKADGFLITNLNGGSITGVGTVTSVSSGAGLLGGTFSVGGTLSVDVGSTANKIVQITSTGQYPQADGNLISNVNAVKIQGRDVVATAPLANQVLRWVGSSWVPSDATVGTLISVSSGTGLLGGTFTVGGTLSVDVGSTAGKIVQITSTGQYPKADGFLITNLNVGSITGVGTVTSVSSGAGLLGGTFSVGGTLSVDTGSTANKIVQITSTGQYPQADGFLVTNINAVKIQGRDVVATAPLANQVLRWVGSSWVPSDAAGTVTSVSSGNGLLGGTFTAGGTLSVDVGSTSGKIVQITSTGQYPKADGFLITNLNGGSITGVGTVTSVSSGAGLLGGTFSVGGTLSVDTGSTANKIVQITSGGQYPQADGNLISNINAVKIQGRDVVSTAPLANQVLRWVGSSWVPSDAAGTVTSVSSGNGLLGGTFTAGGTLSVDVGSTTGKIVQITSNNQYPQADGALVTNLNAIRIQGRGVSSGTVTTNQVLTWNGTAWEGKDVQAGASDFLNGGNNFGGNAQLGLLSNNTLDIRTSSIARISIDQYGNVGIGTTTAAATLEVVNGSISSSYGASATAGGYLGLRRAKGTVSSPTTVTNSSYLGYMDFSGYDGSLWISGAGITGQVVGTPSANFVPTELYFSTGTNSGGTERLRIDSTGKIGINSSTPQAVLDVVGTGTGLSGMIVPRDTLALRPNGVNGMIRYNSQTNRLEGFENGQWGNISAATSGTASQWLNNGGSIYFNSANVGIGTTTPAQPLEIFSSINAALTERINNPNPGASATSRLVFGNDTSVIAGQIVMGSSTLAGFGGANSLNIYQSLNAPVTLITNNLERMRIDGSGMVGIGTNSPQAILDLRGTGTQFSTLLLPRDTTANRPATASSVNGMIRYNSQTNRLEGFENGQWGNISAATAGTATQWTTTGTDIYYNTGNVGIGTISPSSKLQVLDIDTDTKALVVNTTSTVPRQPAVEVINFTNITSGSGSAFRGLAFRGSFAAPAAVQSNDKLAVFQGSGANSAALNTTTGAEIEMTARENFSGTNAGTSMTLRTTPLGSNSRIDTMYLGANGNVGIGTTSPQAALDISGTTTASSALIVPRATTALRPQVPVNGMIRYNSQTNRLEGFENGQWGNISAATSGIAQWSSAGSDIYYNAGMVGIGTNTPTATLDVAGTMRSYTTVYDSSSTANYGHIQNFYYSPGAAPALGAKAYGSYMYAVSQGSSNMPNAQLIGRYTNVTHGVGQTLGEAVGEQVDISGVTTSVLALASAGKFNINNIGSGSITNATGLYTKITNSGGAIGTAYGLYIDTIQATNRYGIFQVDPGANNVFNGQVAIGTTSAPQAMLDVVATGTFSAIIIPRDNVGARPAGVNGMMRFNTTNNRFEVFEGGWTNMTANGGSNGTFNSLYLGNGTAASPSYSFSSNPNLGIYNTGGDLGFSTAGTGRMVVTSGGLVGIGTTSPLGALDVYGVGTAFSAMVVPRDVSASRPSGTNGMIRYNSELNKLETFENGSWKFIATSGSVGQAFSDGGNSFGGGSATIGTISTTNLNIMTNNSTRMTVTSAGNVGIGTTLPAAVLDVEGNVLVGPGFNLSAAAGTGSFNFSSSTGTFQTSSGINTLNGSTVNIAQNPAVAKTVNIGESNAAAGTTTINIGNATGANAGAATVSIGGITAVANTGATTTSIGINAGTSSTGSTNVSIGNVTSTAVTPINSSVTIGSSSVNNPTGTVFTGIGNGTSTSETQSVTIGSVSSFSNTVNIVAGSGGGVNIGNASSGTVTLNSTSVSVGGPATTSVNVGAAGLTNLNIGSAATGNLNTTVGSTTSSSTTAIQAGTGGVNIGTASLGNVNIAGRVIAGTVSSASTGTFTVASWTPPTSSVVVMTGIAVTNIGCITAGSSGQTLKLIWVSTIGANLTISHNSACTQANDKIFTNTAAAVVTTTVASTATVELIYLTVAAGAPTNGWYLTNFLP